MKESREDDEELWQQTFMTVWPVCFAIQTAIRIERRQNFLALRCSYESEKVPSSSTDTGRQSSAETGRQLYFEDSSLFLFDFLPWLLSSCWWCIHNTFVAKLSRSKWNAHLFLSLSFSVAFLSDVATLTLSWLTTFSSLFTLEFR